MIEAKEFRRWMAQIEAFGRPIKAVDLSHLLGRAPETISRYRHNGVQDVDEKVMRLAMAAMSAGLKPWGSA